jgi:hypothetical protein
MLLQNAQSFHKVTPYNWFYFWDVLAKTLKKKKQKLESGLT